MTQDQFRTMLMQKAQRAAAAIGADIVKELEIVLSVPAPLIPGVTPPRAATRATPGAPPRKVSGRGRAGVVYFVKPPQGNTVTVMVGDNVFYMGVHERGNHKWLQKTVDRMMPRMIAKFNALISGD